jgi:hypothetical protein
VATLYLADRNPGAIDSFLAIAKADGWGPVFLVGMSFNLVAALLALVALKPMRARHFAMIQATYAAPAGAVGTRNQTLYK